MRKKVKKITRKSSKTKVKRRHLAGDATLRPIEDGTVKKIKIRVIGIGGGGGSIISEIAAKMPKASFVAANTDIQALKSLGKKVIKMPFGENLTRGLGAGMNPEIGKQAALDAKDKIQKMLEGQDLCIFVACLGGGAGSGAIPVFAKIAQGLGNLSYGIFTMPFKFEGEKKTEIAIESLKKVKSYLNAFSIIPNERVFQIINKETPLKNALSIVNKNLADSLQGLIETLYLPGLINIDFADFKTILEGQGRLTYLNTVEVQRKENSIKELTERVLNSQFYPYGIKGAKGVLFNISGEKNLSLAEVTQISKTISELASPEAKIIFGISQSQKSADTVKTTLLASGCGLKTSPSETKPAVRKITRKIVKKVGQLKEEKKEEPVAPPKQNEPENNAKKPKQIRLKMKPQKMEKQPIQAKEEVVSDESVKVNANKIIQPRQPVVVAQPTTSTEQIRKNALQIKKEAEEMEKEILARESVWDTPAFLRKNLAKEN